MSDADFGTPSEEDFVVERMPTSVRQFAAAPVPAAPNEPTAGGNAEWEIRKALGGYFDAATIEQILADLRAQVRDAALTEAAARAEDFRSGNYDRPDDWTEYATACNVTADRIAQAIRHLREGTPNE